MEMETKTMKGRDGTIECFFWVGEVSRGVDEEIRRLPWHWRPPVFVQTI